MTTSSAVPAERPIGRSVHPLAVVVGPLVGGIGLGAFVPFPVPTPLAVRAAGVAAIAVGLLLGVPALRAMIRARTSPNPHRTPATLVGSGIYARSRNPMYLGLFALYGGAACVLGDGWSLLALPAVILVVDRVVVRSEERRLALRFGPAYADYARRVPRWI